MKKLITVMVALMMVINLLGCSNSQSGQQASTESNTEPVKAYMIGVMSGGEYWGGIEEGFYEACKAEGWEGHYVCPVETASTTEMVDLAETALTDGADVIVITVTDASVMSDVLGRAKEQGVVVLGIAAGDPSLCKANIGYTAETMGNYIAEFTVGAKERYGMDNLRIVTVETALDSVEQNAQLDAFAAKMKELDPDAEIVEKIDCGSDAATAQDKLNAIYLADSTVNCVASFDALGALGTSNFIEENKLQGSFIVAGPDSSTDTLKRAKEKSYAGVITFDTHEMGRLAVSTAKTWLEGGTTEYDQNIEFTIAYADEIDEYAKEHGITLQE